MRFLMFPVTNAQACISKNSCSHNPCPSQGGGGCPYCPDCAAYNCPEFDDHQET